MPHLRDASRQQVVALCFLVAVAVVSPCAAQGSLDGEWIGGWNAGGDDVFVRARFQSEQASIKGTLQVRRGQEAARELQLARVDLNGARIRLEAIGGAGTLVLEGQRAGDVIKGHWSEAEARGAFQLLRVAQVDSSLFHRYAGSYQLEDGNFFSIGRQTRTGANPRLSYVERVSGRRGNLTPISDRVFIGGPALGRDYPPDVRITFEQTGGRLTWQRGGTSQTATRLPLREEEVKFPSGEIALAGTLVLPPGKGPHPAIVLLHGSTPLHRYYFGADPYMYPARGIAVLFYDKRGVGASTGAPSEAIGDLAADALAAVAYLKTRDEIDASQIGLFGHSQGGWVVPEAASRSKDIAFIVAGAASGLPTDENAAYEVDGELRYAGFSEAERARAISLYRLGNTVIRSGGEGWNQWRAEIAKSRNEKWFRLARTPNSIIEMNDANRPRIMNFVEGERRNNYDPVAAWQKITIPTLVYESEWDIYIPARQSEAIIGKALEQAGNRDYTIHVFPRSNHGQWAMQEDGPRNDLSHRVHYDLLFDWLRDRVTVRAEMPDELASGLMLDRRNKK